MAPCGIFTSRPALRWLAPLAFVLVVAGTGLVATTATAERKLPAATAEQLLVDVQQAEVDGLSGTVIQTANLGIPEIPGAGGARQLGASPRWSPAPTRCGSATPSPDKSRLAVLGTYGETDVIMQRHGPVDLVEPRTRRPPTARSTRAAGPGRTAPSAPADLPQDPAGGGRAGARGPRARPPTVTTDSDVTVADRAAYELVLDPNDDAHA